MGTQDIEDRLLLWILKRLGVNLVSAYTVIFIVFFFIYLLFFFWCCVNLLPRILRGGGRGSPSPVYKACTIKKSNTLAHSLSYIHFYLQIHLVINGC